MSTASPTAPGAGSPPPPRSFAHHAGATVRLAFPVMLARSGTLIMISTDVVMTGRLSAVELAFFALGYGLSHNLYVVGLGAMSGTTVLTSQAMGLGRPEECGTVWRVAVLHGLVLGLIFMAISWFAEPILLLTGQEPALAAGGGGVARMFALGLPPMLMYLATAMFLEAVNRPMPNVVLMAGANVLNAGLNWVFMYGGGDAAPGGMFAMGASGAALATSLTRWAMFLGLAGYVWLGRDSAHFGIRGPLRYALDIGRKLRRLGLPLGVAHGLETGAFTMVVLMAGWLGAVPMAVFQIASNLFNVVYMSAIGLATATSVRVGHAVGEGRTLDVRRAGWSGLVLGILVLGTIGAAFHGWPGTLASLYATEETVLALALSVLPVTAVFLLPDGGQGILVGALRGTGDIWIPSFMVTAGFWGVTVPLGYFLAFHQGQSVVGLMWGLVAGGLFASLLLAARFHFRASGSIPPL